MGENVADRVQTPIGPGSVVKADSHRLERAQWVPRGFPLAILLSLFLWALIALAIWALVR